jgi:hypothetical protein
MKLMPLLRDLRIGADAAENDEDLSSYFVKTSTFWDIVSDSADVILGPKGTGKSAISRQLSDDTQSIPDLEDVDIIPAFNLHGSVLFRKLSQDLGQVSESWIRTAWFAYIACLVGNHLVAEYPECLESQEIKQLLATAGGLDETNELKSIWTKILGAVRKVFPKRLEADLTIDGSGAPKLAGIADFESIVESTEPPIRLKDFDWENLLELEINFFKGRGRRCWVLFDRLDEAFPHDRALERCALRGLLRAHMDICSYGNTLRTKLFLRTDILDRITVDAGFVNATHLRVQRIQWDRATIVDLIAKRVAESKLIRSTFSITPASLTTSNGRNTVCYIAIPSRMESQDGIDWLIRQTVDATHEPTPRNIITLLRNARARQLQICDRDDPEFEEIHSLISTISTREGWRELSVARLEDTIYAEFNHLRPIIEKLRGRYTTYTASELARTLGLDVDSETFRRGASFGRV